jgi:hypothetical protein
MVARTRKRWLLFAAVGGLLCIPGLLYVLALLTSHHVDQDHFKLIIRGMTESEVEAIFGVPAGCYDGAEQDEERAITHVISFTENMEEMIEIDQLAFSGRTIFISGRHGPNPYVKTWCSRQGVFHVAFDNQGHVAATGVWGKSNVEPFWRRMWQRLVGK